MPKNPPSLPRPRFASASGTLLVDGAFTADTEALFEAGSVTLSPAPAADAPPPAPDDEIRSLRPHSYRDAVDDRLGASGSPADFARKAQFVDYESMRALFESRNAHPRGDARALSGRLSDPAWHSAVWEAHEGRLEAGGSYYGARKGSEPLHVQAGGDDGKVLVVNRTDAAVAGVTVTARLYDLGGRPIGDPVAAVVDVPACDTADAFTVAFGRALPATHLLRLRLADDAGRVLSANDYWRYRTATDLRAVNGLPSVRLSVQTRPAGPAGILATVRNTGSAPAAMVRLCLVDPHSGEPVLPALADDNYLWLLPGESRDVTLSWTPGASAAPAPAVAAEAYNAPRVTA